MPPKAPIAPGAQGSALEWWMGIGFTAMVIGFLSGPILLVYHVGFWLKTGFWEDITVADGLNWVGLRPLHTQWLGLQRVFDWAMGSPLWAALPIATGLLMWLVFGMADANAKPNASPRRATTPLASNLPPSVPPPVQCAPVAKLSWSKVVKRIFGGWLWPLHRREETSGAIRGGRVIHWTFLVFAAPPAVVAGFAIFVITERDMFGIFVSAFMIALGLALVGRGLRYVLANE
jgi:hypothetical protein